MHLYAKRIAKKLEQILDDMGAPANNKERATMLSKMLDISKQEAWNLLEGHVLPNEIILEKITTELELDLKP